MGSPAAEGRPIAARVGRSRNPSPCVSTSPVAIITPLRGPDAGSRALHSPPTRAPFSATERFMNNTANVTTKVNTAAIQKQSKKAREDACC
jgi:hypothetical protein